MAFMKHSLNSCAISVLNKSESAYGTKETCPYNGVILALQDAKAVQPWAHRHWSSKSRRGGSQMPQSR